MITNNKHYFSMARAVELQDETKTLEEAKTRFERSCSICPKAGFCIEGKCYLAQLHAAKMALLEVEELCKTVLIDYERAVKGKKSFFWTKGGDE